MVEQREDIRPGARPGPADGWARRLEAMGIEVQSMPGGGATLATMALSAQPFPALERSSRFERVLFATVGRHHLKCLKPAALFYLRSRGIGPAGAQRLLVRAFLQEVVSRVPEGPARAEAGRLLEEWLSS